MKASTILSRPFVAAIGIAAIAVPAHAADVVFQEPPSAPPPAMMAPAPLDTWSGPYAGISGGFAWGRIRDRNSGERESTSGWMIGGFAGYQMQYDMFVFGGEADLNYAHITGSWGNGFANSRTSLDGSLRARAGVAVTDDILLYGTAGVAAQRLRINTAAPSNDTQLMVGGTVGAGMDARLTDQVFGRVEYRYTQYGNKTFDLGFGGGNPNIGTSDHRVTVGLGMRF